MELSRYMTFIDYNKMIRQIRHT